MPTKQLSDLFFQAGKTELLNNGVSYNPRQYAIQGDPPNVPQITYKSKNKDFNFVSYKRAYLGGLCRSARLFSINPNNIRLQKVDYGKRFQWALIELTQDAKTVKIADEDYQPYILIGYKYDNPSVIHYHFGVVRMACSNGIISGLKFFSNQEVKTKDFKICDPFFNPCLIDILIGRYNLLFNTMKTIKLTNDEMKPVFEMILGRQLKASDVLGEKNDLENNEHSQSESEFFDAVSKKYTNLGNNMYGVFNMFTDYATHYNVNERDEENEIPHQIISRQQRAGDFLDDLFGFLEQSGHFIFDENIESKQFGMIDINPDSNINITSILTALSKK